MEVVEDSDPTPADQLWAPQGDGHVVAIVIVIADSLSTALALDPGSPLGDG